MDFCRQALVKQRLGWYSAKVWLGISRSNWHVDISHWDCSTRYCDGSSSLNMIQYKLNVFTWTSRNVHRVISSFKTRQRYGVQARLHERHRSICRRQFCWRLGSWECYECRQCFSRTGYVNQYAGFPITWQSKLQTEIALSTAKAKYIELSQALRETLPMTNLMKEINVIFPLYLPLPRFVIKVSEKIISHALRWLTIPNSLLKPSTLQSNIIIFASM